MKDNKLEVGDVLYTNDRWHGVRKSVIDRVTATTAISGASKFKIDVVEHGSGLSVRMIGSYGYAYLETDEYIREFRLKQKRNTLYRKLKDLDIYAIDESRIDEILNVLP